MTAELSSEHSPAAGTELVLDLQAEARNFLRGRFPVAGTGIGLGLAFLAIGGVELAIHARSGPLLFQIASPLLLVLGIAVTYRSVTEGQLNPVTKLRADLQGVTFERRRGRPLILMWKNPNFWIDVEDLGPDPAASPEAKLHLYFNGPRPVYGALDPTSLGRLLDVAQAHQMVIGVKLLEDGSGKAVHRVRRVRIRPAAPA